MENLEKFRQQFDNLYLIAFTEKVNSIRSLSSQKVLDQLLDQLIELSKNGKRVRPYFAMITSDKELSEMDNSELAVLYAIETLHLFCLVHDDITDQAEKRHGTKTLQKFYLENYENCSSHLADTQAMLIGDLTFNLFFDFIRDTEESPHKTEIRHAFKNNVNKVVFGQILDVVTMHSGDLDESVITEKTSLKVSHYTFTYPLYIGSLMSQETDFTFEQAQAIGTPLGIAYQTQDDYLDIFGGQKITKTLARDIISGVQTHLTLELSKRNIDDYEKIKSFRGKDITENELHLIQNIFLNNGIDKFINELVQNNIFLALENLHSSDLSKLQKKIIREVINFFINRSY